jgi:acyl-coenzyme A thioesterase PaaI-like protein
MGVDDAPGRVAQSLARPYARFFGFELVSAEPGAVTLALAHRPDFEHAPSFFHGTVTTAIAELAASYSAMTGSQVDWTHLVLEQSIHFLGAAWGDQLVGVGRVIRPGRAISFAASDVFVERDGERHLCAKLSLTMRHVRPEARA